MLALLCAPLLSSLGASASPSIVESFDAKTWTRLRQELPRPAAVVFTATHCANCPAVIARLTQSLQDRGLAQHVIAVVIDAAQEQALLSSRHYESASRLFAFSDTEAKLRYAVDPRWRGETPYIALLSARDDIVFVTGTPSDAQIEAWTRSLR